MERTLREKRSHPKGEREQLYEQREGFECMSVFRLSSKGSPIVGNPKPTIQIGCKLNYR